MYSFGAQRDLGCGQAAPDPPRNSGPEKADVRMVTSAAAAFWHGGAIGDCGAAGSVDIRCGSRVCLPEHSMEATVIDGDLRSVGNRHTSDPIRLDRST